MIKNQVSVVVDKTARPKAQIGESIISPTVKLEKAKPPKAQMGEGAISPSLRR